MTDIPRRRVDFDLDPASVPRDWATDAYTTTVLDALSLLFPEGERFFVESVKQHAHLVTDPVLRADVTAFITQEAMHGKARRGLNELLVAHGYAEAPAIERRLRGFLQGVRRRMPPRSQLAVTCALEHFTAIMAEELLSNRRMRDELSATMIDLWTWHALEETEHKTVAYDVYDAAGGEYGRRVAIMLLTTAVFFAALAVVQARLMATRKILWKPWTWARGTTRMWLYPGYFLRLVPAYLTYFAPGFHPAQRDTTELVAHWREQLFGAHGTLSSSYKIVGDTAA